MPVSVIVMAICCSIGTLASQPFADPVQYRVVSVEADDFCEHGPWELVFEEEFEGTELDADRWITFFPYCLSGDDCLHSRVHGWPENMAIYSDSNVVLSGQGTVRITARAGPMADWHGTGSVYTTGMLHTRHQFSRGRFEARIKVPRSKGHNLWPAFWLFGGGPYCTEIDILEIIGAPSYKYHRALHRYAYGCSEKHASEGVTRSLGELSDDFHVYRADWDKWFVNFYIDDELIARSCRLFDLLNRPVSSCHVPAGNYIQNQAFPAQDAEVSIILTLAVMQRRTYYPFGGLPVPDLPATMEVDYVRVYRR